MRLPSCLIRYAACGLVAACMGSAAHGASYFANATLYPLRTAGDFVTDDLDILAVTNAPRTAAAAFSSGPLQIGGQSHPGIQGTASVASDLRTGTFKVYAQGDSTSPAGEAVVSSQAHLRYLDSLSFSVANASADTLTPVSLTLRTTGQLSATSAHLDETGFPDNQDFFSFLRLDGTGFGAAAGKKVSAQVSLSMNHTFATGTSAPQPNASYIVDTGEPTQQVTTHWATTSRNDYFSLDRYEMTEDGAWVIEITALLKGAAPTLDLEFVASAFANGGEVDFGHTSMLDINVPAGVSWVSESGLLLSPVPEPQGTLLLAGGLAVVATLLRLRRAGAPRPER